MNKGLLIVGLVGVAAAGYLLLSNQAEATDTGAGGGGGSKKETYSETTTSPYEQSQPIFNIEAPAPMINLVPGFDTFRDYITDTSSSTKKPTYGTGNGSRAVYPEVGVFGDPLAIAPVNTAPADVMDKPAGSTVTDSGGYSWGVNPTGGSTKKEQTINKPVETSLSWTVGLFGQGR